MKIVAYDDDIKFIDILKKSLVALNNKHGGVFDVSTFFNNISDTLACAKDCKGTPSIFLLDVVAANQQVGYELAKSIKNINPDNLIIYVTDFTEEIIYNMTQKLMAVCFVLKSSEKFLLELEEGILFCRDLLNDKFFVAENNSSLLRVRYDDIFFFEKYKGTQYINIVHMGGNFSFKGNLTEISAKLELHFIFANKSVIVNTRNIQTLEKSTKTLHFEYGHECNYSRLRQGELYKWIRR